MRINLTIMKDKHLKNGFGVSNLSSALRVKVAVIFSMILTIIVEELLRLEIMLIRTPLLFIVYRVFNCVPTTHVKTMHYSLSAA
jgi:hypothetical protein